MEPHRTEEMSSAARRARAEAATQCDLALEPAQAWFLKGHFGDQDEVVIPGLLLDDLGGCTAVEASLTLPIFHQMLALAGRADNAMLTERAATPSARSKPEANVWAVVAERSKRRLSVQAIVALDRVVVDGYGTRRVALIRATDLIPDTRS